MSKQQLQSKVDSLELEIKHLDAIMEATRLINSTLDTVQLMRFIRQIGVKQMNAERVTIFLADVAERKLHSVFIGEENLAINLPFGTGIAGTTAETGESIIVDDVRKDERFYDGIDRISGFTTKSLLCVPMYGKDKKLVGVVQALNSEIGAFSEQDLRFAHDLAIAAVLAIENARLYSIAKEKVNLERALDEAKLVENELFEEIGDIEELKGEINHLKTIIRATWLLNSTLDFEYLMELLRRIAKEDLKAEKATIYLADAEKEIIHSAYIEDKHLDINLPFGVGLAGMVAKTGETINIENAQTDKRFYDKIDQVSGFISRSVLCAPMRDKEDKLLGVFQVLNSEEGKFSPQDQRFLEDLSVQAALAIENARLYSEALQKKKLEEELDVARDIQQRLLPTELPKVDGYDIAAINVPAQQVGGDYYDLFPIEGGGFRFGLGDVSGKGVSAALLMANIQASFEAQVSKELPMSEITRIMNRHIYHSTSETKYITFFSGQIDRDGNTISYCNAGHNPPILCCAKNPTLSLDKGGIPLGYMEDAEYIEGTVSLTSGQVLVLYSDGVTEAMDDEENEFGPENLENLVKECLDKPAATIIDKIFEALEEHTGGTTYDDDVTLLVLRKL